MHRIASDGNPPAPPRARRRLRGIARASFHLHLWLGVLSTGVLVMVAITGIILNHKRGLGLMPDVSNQVSGSLSEALSMAELAQRANTAVGDGIAGQGIDRMDVRPDDALIKVRYEDRLVTEATLDINTGAVLHVGTRNDVFLEKLHSGEIFGDGWVLLTDAAAVLLLIVLVTGYWLWLYPKAHK